MLAFALCALTILTVDLPPALPVGTDFYLVGPAIKLARYITNEKFSRDGRFVTFIDESPEQSYPKEREFIERGDFGQGRALVRVDLNNGTRQSLYEPQLGETLMDVTTIGTGGDTVCTIAVGQVVDGKNGWRLLYCPVGGQPQIVCDKLSARSFQVIGSPTETKAFALIAGSGAPTKYLFITQDGTLQREIGFEAFQGFFLPSFSSGFPIAAIQGPAPDYKLLSYVRFDFASGSAARISELPKPDSEAIAKPILAFNTVERSKGIPVLGQAPLCDLVVKSSDEKDKKKFLIVAQGVTDIARQTENGLAVIYSRDDGYYVREMVKASPVLAKRLAQKM